jgi:NAD(P)H-hydrate epimerase
VLTRDLLQPLAGHAAALTDKRTYGHLFVVGGSRSFPGAILMTVQAALRSGVGLVTAFVPEVRDGGVLRAGAGSDVGGVAGNAGGGLALEGEHLLRERLSRATALAMGPGMGGRRRR